LRDETAGRSGPNRQLGQASSNWERELDAGWHVALRSDGEVARSDSPRVSLAPWPPGQRRRRKMASSLTPSSPAHGLHRVSPPCRSSGEKPCQCLAPPPASSRAQEAAQWLSE